MKKLMILAVALLATGCASETKLTPVDDKTASLSIAGSPDSITVIQTEVDGCEYVVFRSGHGVDAEHKPRCKGCRR